LSKLTFSTRTISVDQFVPRAEIDDLYIDQPYYIVPIGQQAFGVIRDAINKKGISSPQGGKLMPSPETRSTTKVAHRAPRRRVSIRTTRAWPLADGSCS
jgi:hypothetical protein